MRKVFMTLAVIAFSTACGGTYCTSCIAVAACTTATASTPTCGVGLVCCNETTDGG